VTMAATPPTRRARHRRTGFPPRRGRPKRHGDRLHLQSLPLREGRDRPDGRGYAHAARRGHRVCGDLFERREILPGGSFTNMQRFAKAHGSRDRSMRRASTQCSRARSSIS
jgi:hypothetical protein